MARLIVLDAGPIGLLCQKRTAGDVGRCWDWREVLDYSGAIVCLPEIAVYEVRRELLRQRRNHSLGRMRELIGDSLYLSINRQVMEHAAQLWALIRQAVIPTASPESLDADCILAAQALNAVGLGDVVTVATTNVVHLAHGTRFAEHPTAFPLRSCSSTTNTPSRSGFRK